MAMIARLVVVATALLCCSARPAHAQVCVGDCDGNGTSTIDELVRGVNILLGRAALTRCSTLDTNGDENVAVNELVRAVADVLQGCGVTRPTPEPTFTRTITATPTNSPPPTVTPTATLAIPDVAGEWREDQYELASSMCGESIDNLFTDLLSGLPPCDYTVTQDGPSVTLTDCHDIQVTGSFGENGLLQVDLPTLDQTQDGCTIVFDPEFAAALTMSPTTVVQSVALSFAGTCEREPCAMTVTSRWTRL